MGRSPRFLVILLAAIGFALSWASTAQARRTLVGPGDSIQAAVDAADPGDRILVYGTHRENVAVQTDGLTLRGVGAVILPPATPAVHACFDPTDPDEAVHGICVIGDVDFTTGDVTRRVEGVTVSGFTVRDFAGAGIATVAASGTTVKRNVTVDNRDSGINVNVSRDTRVRANDISGSRFGVFVSAGDGSRFSANSIHENCVGVLLLGAPGNRLAYNAVRGNTRACAAGEFPALSGAGVLVIESRANTIVRNLIVGNRPEGESLFSGGVVVARVEPEGEPSADNVVAGNVILRNAPDLVWDEAGTGNVFRRNLCRTSTPRGLCGGW
jgi:parallel beta-helix repeat protein